MFAIRRRLSRSASPRTQAHGPIVLDGGVTLVAINTSRTRPASIEPPIPAQRYTLMAQKLEDTGVRLNGHEHKLEASNELPSLKGTLIQAEPVELAPASITFLTVADAANGS
jgi:heparanase 1